MAFIKSEFAKGRGASKKLLSAAYKEQLGMLVNEDIRTANHLPNGATWADFIAYACVERAVGIRNKELICFTAITELREATEGKIPEAVAIGGGNPELLALADSLSRGPEPLPEREEELG